jgi:uncharacterized membrane protein YphA (DoxX/SURF4 family)
MPTKNLPRQVVGEVVPADHNGGTVPSQCTGSPAGARTNPAILCGVSSRTFAAPPGYPEGETSLATSRYQIGAWAAAAIVALRLVIGLHFFSQGVEKIRDPKPFSASFFGAAKGPLAPLFHGMVWDADGRWRLSEKDTLEHWDAYKNQVVAHFQFDEGQSKRAGDIYKAYSSRLKWYLRDRADDIAQYQQTLARRDKYAADPTRTLASLRAHDARIAQERSQLIGPILSNIDKLWKDYESDLNALSTTEQWKRHGRLKLGKVGRNSLDSETSDRFIPYFDLAVGFLLIVGLFTRPAAIVGGLFLAMVCLTQWPGAYGAQPVYYQAIEMLALFTLAAIGAGQFAGLDFLLSSLWRRPPRPTLGART